MSKIEGKVAFVTGANRGIGKAFVEELLNQGASKIYATARNKEKLGQLVELGNGRVVPVEFDVTSQKQIKLASDTYKDVSLLINNAGIASFEGLIAANTDSAARNEMETNYFGTLNVTRAFAPSLKANGGGAIINISSIAGLVNFPVLGSYSASKAAVHSLTQGIRAELAQQGTQVTGVYPGPVDTDMAAEFLMDKTPTNDVVRTILKGLEEGLEDIYPEVVSAEMHLGLLGDPKAVEKQTGEMLPA